MNDTAMIVIPLMIALLLLSAGVYWYGRRAKNQLDERVPVSRIGVDEPLDVTGQCAEALHALSAEPVLVKQQLDGTRVQIENRPMVPIALFAGKDVAGALTEAASRISERFGLEWVAIVAVREDGKVTVNRIS